MATKEEKKAKIKKLVKEICKKDDSFLDDPNITFQEVIEVIGQYQEPKFKVKNNG